MFYGIIGPRGGLTRIQSEFTQKFSKKDVAGIQREFSKAKGGLFVLYEERTRQTVTKDGKPVYKKKDGKYLKTADGKRVPMKRTKLTVGKVGVGQREVLYKRGKRIRASQGFVARTKRELVDGYAVQVLEPQYKGEMKFKHKMFLTGATILDTVRRLKLPFTPAQMKRNKWIGISTEIEIAVMQGNVRLFDPALTAFAYTDVLSDFALDLGKAIRFKLADHGYRFTSLVTLYELAEEFPEFEDKLLFAGSKPRRPVENLDSIFPEFEGMDTLSRKSPQAPKVFIRLNIQPY